MLPAGLFGAGTGAAVGLVGGGGSILAVPALVYGLGMPVGQAVSTSLLVVAGTAVAGVVPRLRRGEVRWRVAGVFGAAGVAAAFGGAAVNRLLPERWLLGGFAALMLVVGATLLRGQPQPHGACEVPGGGVNWHACLPKALGIGAGVGFLTGLLGVGGGFVIVPALAWLLGLPLPVAIATSLVILVLNSLAGLAAHLGQLQLDVAVAGVFLGAAALTALAAGRLAGRLPERVLRRGFAALVLAVGVFVAVQAALGNIPA
ncbi:MAG: sulfite exporter TauE/SafE family protein [Actinomycetota bacterium]|nr:sulfite exporter TauE/SafE family protein [Actinomycetota bacterium]